LDGIVKTLGRISEAIKLMSPEWDYQSTRLIRWKTTTMALTPPKWGLALIIIILFYHGL